MPRTARSPRPVSCATPQPFASPEELWFWFSASWAARQDGARILAGQGDTERPCEPVDVMRIVDRLYRQRRLVIDHVKVLAHYGRRHLPPDAGLRTEARAHHLWHEALGRLEPVLRSKGIVQ